MAFDDMKSFNGQKYTGMPVGLSHHWNYPNGEWEETKVAPDMWKIRFTSLKSRKTPAPEGSGAPLKTSYHWYILADQLNPLNPNLSTEDFNFHFNLQKLWAAGEKK